MRQFGREIESAYPSPPCLTFIAYRWVEQLLQPVDKGRVGGAHRSGQVHPTANGEDRDLIA